MNKYEMAKRFSYARNEASIAQKAALDGLYELRAKVVKSNRTPVRWFWPTRV